MVKQLYCAMLLFILLASTLASPPCRVGTVSREMRASGRVLNYRECTYNNGIITECDGSTHKGKFVTSADDCKVVCWPQFKG
ncbi:unnamed protein product [Bursaphelenchus okinawaensis]|uniref:Secreted protein n=1 Tax=Bursaphelenchus okinawaensis TaxID=465554 RepID=A0A811L9Q8_9BILA|nr:unnamed protein product [Bursaphelenchus okinawaensis]CAG9118990.1 unnamed protein product [Bursaphelenchus okinawaensis]